MISVGGLSSPGRVLSHDCAGKPCARLAACDGLVLARADPLAPGRPRTHRPSTESIVAGYSTVLINGRRINAHPGDTLLDAAMASGIVIPHDCCTGQCSTCRVRVYDGEVDDQGTRERDTVRACQATVSGDVVIEFDEVPLPGKRSGTVTMAKRSRRTSMRSWSRSR